MSSGHLDNECYDDIREGRLVDYLGITDGGSGAGVFTSGIFPVYLHHDPYYGELNDTALDDNNCHEYRYKGRLIDYMELGSGFVLPVYETWDSCCEYPLGLDNVFYNTDCIAYPISKHLLARVTDASSCPGLDCTPASGTSNYCQPTFTEGILTLSTGDTEGPWLWTGSVGGIALQIKCEDGTLSAILPASGCGATFSTSPGLFCDKIFHYHIPSLNVDPSCCDCTTSELGSGGASLARVTIDVYGFCTRRHPARLVDFVADMPVYMYSEYCPKECEEKPCCSNHNCDLQATFVGLDSCNCLDGETILLPYVGGSIVDPQWQNNTFGSCSPPHQWDMELRCMDLSDLCSRFEFTLQCNPNCRLIDYVTGPYCCSSEIDIEFEFTLACDANCNPPFYTCCCDEGSYRYMVRITCA